MMFCSSTQKRWDGEKENNESEQEDLRTADQINSLDTHLKSIQVLYAFTLDIHLLSLTNPLHCVCVRESCVPIYTLE